MNDLSPLTATIWLGLWIYLLQQFLTLINGAALASNRELTTSPQDRTAEYIASRALALPRAALFATVAAVVLGLVYSLILPWIVEFVIWLPESIPRLLADLFTNPLAEVHYASGRQVFAVGCLFVVVPYLIWYLSRLGRRWAGALLSSRVGTWVEREISHHGDDWLEIGLPAARARSKNQARKNSVSYVSLLGAKGERVLYLLGGAVGSVLLVLAIVIIFLVVVGGFTAATPVQVLAGVILTLMLTAAVNASAQMVSLSYLRYFAAPSYVVRQEEAARSMK